MYTLKTTDVNPPFKKLSFDILPIQEENEEKGKMF